MTTYSTKPETYTQCELAEISAQVAGKVMGWKLVKQAKPDLWHFIDPTEDDRVLVGFSRVAGTWNPAFMTTDAWEVAEKMRKEFLVWIHGSELGWNVAIKEKRTIKTLGRCINEFLPLALCRAALLAVARNGGADHA